MIALLKKLLRRVPGCAPKLPDGEHLVASSQGCEHCGSGVLKIVIGSECRLRCMQCLALDLEISREDAVKWATEFSWEPSQSSRYGS